jgi:hypothetical protein
VREEKNVLWRYNPVEIEFALRQAAPAPPFPPIDDRAAWAAVAARLGEAEVTARVARAEAVAREPVPALPATLFLTYLRSERRDGYADYHHPRQQRRNGLTALMLAECLEGAGRFLDALLDYAWAICEESSWNYPVHQGVLTDLDKPVIALGAAMTAFELAECHYLVGARLDPALGKRIRDEVERRCLTPFLTRHDFWWLYNTAQRGVNNWTAVCVGGVVGAAIYLEDDPARLAELIARGARSLTDYLETFDEDGGSSEGPSYWSYGFGYFTMLADLVAKRTDGQIRFLDGGPDGGQREFLRRIANYPLRTSLSQGHQVTFSDCYPDLAYEGSHLAYLARHFASRELLQLAREQPNQRTELSWQLRALFWRPEPPQVGESTRFIPARHDYFRGMQWFFARYDPADPDALTLAAKGGHNDEMHNHNDVGTVIVHVGGESLIADIGRGRYSKAYWGPERYDLLVKSSRGHSVPIVNGYAQGGGRDYAARVLEHAVGAAADGEDRLVLALEGTYPTEAGVAALTRTIALHRRPPRGAVTLADCVRFAYGPGHLTSVITTFAPVAVGDGQVRICGAHAALQIDYDAGTITVEVVTEPAVDFPAGPQAVNRILFTLRVPAEEASIRLAIVPE